MIAEKMVKVLVVDDEIGIRDLLEMELGFEGYSVATAVNANDAIAKLKKEKYDVVLCDIKMPKGSGIQVLKEAKKTQPETEIIIMTGYGNETSYNESMKYGASAFISKPFHIDEVLASIEKAVKKL